MEFVNSNIHSKSQYNLRFTSTLTTHLFGKNLYATDKNWMAGKSKLHVSLTAPPSANTLKVSWREGRLLRRDLVTLWKICVSYNYITFFITSSWKSPSIALLFSVSMHTYHKSMLCCLEYLKIIFVDIVRYKIKRQIVFNNKMYKYNLFNNCWWYSLLRYHLYYIF